MSFLAAIHVDHSDNSRCKTYRGLGFVPHLFVINCLFNYHHIFSSVENSHLILLPSAFFFPPSSRYIQLPQSVPSKVSSPRYFGRLRLPPKIGKLPLTLRFSSQAPGLSFRIGGSPASIKSWGSKNPLYYTKFRHCGDIPTIAKIRPWLRLTLAFCALPSDLPQVG